MKSKKYYLDLINHTKIIEESEILNSNGAIDLYLQLWPTEHSSNKMTINELAKEMREGFKQINQRLDNIEKRLDEHDAIFARNNIK